MASSADRKTIIALSLITAVCLAGDSMLYIILPIQWLEIGLNSLVQVGVLLSINRFVRLPLTPLIGYIYKKLRFHHGILIAVILAGITTFSYALVDGFSGWILLRSLWGISWSLFKMGAFLLIINLTSEINRGNLIGTYNGLYRLGSLVGMILGGFLAEAFGLKVISMVLGLIVFATIPFTLKYLPRIIVQDPKKVEKPNALRSLRLLKESRLVWVFITAFLSVMILESMFMAMLSHLIHLQNAAHFHMFGLILGAASIAGLLQAVRWGGTPFILPKIGEIVDGMKQKTYFLSFFLLVATALLFIIPFNIPIFIWWTLLLFHLLITSCIATIIDTIFSSSLTKSNNILMVTIYTIIVDLGAAVGPILGYVLEGIIGIAKLLWFCAAIFLMLTVKWVIISSYTKRNNTNCNQSLYIKKLDKSL
ncbi:MFS family permease [Bacillus mesophilus]|uniref:MFS transporter n=1 Tax=Bacillus mesophilus TaxID=1808955 RepID=A0A6M0Q491_9BACI|nr:MFS transporter [Bacillus mesophilus]MBM7661330.1 MFS family permease [Bacillus mesophilus]NEY71151.1 MFS transporter [Bacillus mesophilus]